MLSDKEKQLIVNLRKNSRVNIKRVAKECHYPTSTMYGLLHRLEGKNILSYEGKVSFEDIGYPLQVFIIAKTTSEKRNELKNYLVENKNVNSLHIINHRSDFHLECIFSHQREAEEFLENMKEKNTLTEIKIYTVIENIHSDRFLTKMEHFTK